MKNHGISWLNIVLITVLFVVLLGNNSKALANSQILTGESCPDNMAFILGGTFDMGESRNFPEELVVEDVTVNSFCMDRTEVTNAEFAQFVEETGYITVAERPLSPEDFPNLADNQRAPGSVVFTMPKQRFKAIPELSWWQWKPGANWRHPYGPDSNIQTKDNYPVVQVAYEDARVYAEWAGKQLPTEAQWEYAARGGLKGKTYVWGNQYSAKKANTWQGFFPFFNSKEDGYENIAPVGSFEPNGYGLYDMAGNVWEWTSDWYRIDRQNMAHSVEPKVSDREESVEPKKLGLLRVIKGGSYLCAPNYCSRYRPAARESQEPNTGTTHIGFRLVIRAS